MSWLKKIFGNNASTPNQPPVSIPIRGGLLPLLPINANSAFQEWQQRRKSAQGTVVILSHPFEHIEIKQEAAQEDPLEVIEASKSVDLATFFPSRREGLGLDEDEEEEDEEYTLSRQEPDPAKLTPSPNPQKTFLSIDGGIFLADIPCQEPWQVFAYCAFGNWNDVPPDHALTAVFKSWYDRFGAVPALISSDVIEFWVEKPITDPATAAKLAMEMYILCPDIVDQGTESTEALANSILGANVWYFWWD